MSYCIMNVIYGVPITEQLHQYIRDQEAELEEDIKEDVLEDLEQYGFEYYYTAGGDSSGYCGVELGRFDECTDYLAVDNKNCKIMEAGRRTRTVKLKPTAAQIKAAKARVAKLPPHIKKLCPKIGVYIVPSSS